MGSGEFRNAPAAATANAQAGYEHNTPGLFDQELSLTGGNYTFDADDAQDKAFAELLNAACGGATDAACSFTQSTLTYGPGPLTLATPQFNTCVGPNGGPDNDDNYACVEYDASQTATLSVGGGLSVGAESSIFGAVTVGSTVSVEASKQWGDTATYDANLEGLPPGEHRGLHLVVADGRHDHGNARRHDRIGDLHRHELLPGAQRRARALRSHQRPHDGVQHGHQGAADDPERTNRQLRRRRAPRRSAERGAPPGPARSGPLGRSCGAGGHPGDGVAASGLAGRCGASRDGHAKGLEGCSARRGLHGTFEYKKRKLSVVFGPDARVAALIYRGRLTTKDGLGKDDSIAKLRARYARIYCTRFARRLDCAIPRRLRTPDGVPPHRPAPRPRHRLGDQEGAHLRQAR